MRRFSLTFLAALALVATSIGVRALDLELSNASKTPLHHLYFSTVGEKNWGEDQLGDTDEDVVGPGDSYTLTDIEPGKYDLKLVASDGTECVLGNVRFGVDKTWTVTEAMLDSCGK